MFTNSQGEMAKGKSSLPTKFPQKCMVGRLNFFWNCQFSGANQDVSFREGTFMSKLKPQKCRQNPPKVLKAASTPSCHEAQAAKDTQDCRQWRRRAESLEVGDECSADDMFYRGSSAESLHPRNSRWWQLKYFFF